MKTMIDTIRDNPEIKRLRAMAANSNNSEAIKKQIARIRVVALKATAAEQKQQYQLTPEEIEWMASVLERRIERSGSVKEMQIGLENDCLSDFDRLMVDTRSVRKNYAKAAALATRYPTMADSVRKPSADEYVDGTMKTDEVPEINLEIAG